MRLAALLFATALLAACATATPEEMLGDDAVANTRTEANGDVITEYRIDRALRSGPPAIRDGAKVVEMNAVATAVSAATLFFGAMNRTEDAMPFLPALNQALAEAEGLPAHARSVAARLA